MQRFLAAATILALTAMTACIEYEADPAPLDRFKNPIHALAHPGGQYAYVLNSNFDVEFLANRGGSVSVVDLNTNQIVATGGVRLPSFGAEMVFGGDVDAPDRLFVSTRGGAELIVLDISESGDALSCQSTQEAADCIIHGPGRDLTSMVWLDRVDTDSGEADLLAIATLGGSLSILGIGDVLRASKRVDARGLDGGISLIRSPVDGTLYLGARYSGRLNQYSWTLGSDGLPAAVYSVGAVDLALAATNRGMSFSELRGLVHSTSGPRMYALTNTPRSILTIALERDSDDERALNVVESRLPISERVGSMVGATVDGRELLYVAHPDVDRVDVIDPAQSSVIARIDVGERPSGLAIDEVGKRLLVSHFGDDSLGVVSLDSASDDFHTLTGEVR